MTIQTKMIATNGKKPTPLKGGVSRNTIHYEIWWQSFTRYCINAVSWNHVGETLRTLPMKNMFIATCNSGQSLA